MLSETIFPEIKAACDSETIESNDSFNRELATYRWFCIKHYINQSIDNRESLRLIYLWNHTDVCVIHLWSHKLGSGESANITNNIIPNNIPTLLIEHGRKTIWTGTAISTYRTDSFINFWIRKFLGEIGIDICCYSACKPEKICFATGCLLLAYIWVK